MKSDVIRKRSRHFHLGRPPSASPGVSRRASPVPRQLPSPVLAPDSSTALSYNNYQDEYDYSTPQSDLMGALGPDVVYSSSEHYDSSMGYMPTPDRIIQTISRRPRTAPQPTFLRTRTARRWGIPGMVLATPRRIDLINGGG